MAVSMEDMKHRLRAEFGKTLAGPRDEGLSQMADTLAAGGEDRAGIEAALAQMVEAGTIRYISEPVGGVGAGVLGVLDAPTGGTFGMSDGRPQHGAIAASQQHGTGYWDLGGQ